MHARNEIFLACTRRGGGSGKIIAAARPETAPHFSFINCNIHFYVRLMWAAAAAAAGNLLFLNEAINKYP